MSRDLVYVLWLICGTILQD